ncbi:MAG: tRNA (adenosine(37)-N6)-threonylcarbamoyltransferase complex transferase subunit TsaD [Bacilli bacterium]|nr:tRNA (adenosine(37)-N6)-threonylcarbamoyltransferase complex transferase subunit TsaD [Bacilli bacterium]
MLVLGVESSCDETSVAVVRDGKEILSNIIYSQIDIHKEFGGVVPEVASRHHIKKITIVFEEAFKKANVLPSDIDVVAVTGKPGLVGSLLVGINAAEAFALAFNIPCIKIDHITGHIYANYIEHTFDFPLLALVVSGGHTELVLMKEHYSFEKLGETLDDAIGEAYDKVGRVLGLPYPGGVYVDKISQGVTPTYELPLVYLDNQPYNFSFSGLKSAVLNIINKANMKKEVIDKASLAASFQSVAVKVLVDKTINAAKEFKVKKIVIAGGVAANSHLRNSLKEAAKAIDLEVNYPSMKYCTDNAAMIAVSGYFKYKLNK